MEDPSDFQSFAFLGDNGEEGKGGPWEALERDLEWLEPVHEISVADWLVERCGRWYRPPYYLAYFPVCYDDCARVLHPASRLTESKEHAPIRWSEVASWNNYTVHSLTQFREITDIRKWFGPQFSYPDEGELPSKEREILAGLLREFTKTPEMYYFCFWDGYGQSEFDPTFALLPKVKIFDREYYLFHGNLDPDLAGKAFNYRPPTYWWPGDRAWCVYTDIDATDTFIGGSAACIEAVLNHPELEALPITLEARVDGDGDAP